MGDRDPYAVLAREHRLIERALDVLSGICEEFRRTKGQNTADAMQVIQFLSDFADRTHHLKEERILFPAIAAKTFFPGCGLVGEHQMGRDRVRAMAESVERSSRGDAEGVRAFPRQARSLIGMLREHIAKEDDCLADVADRTFSSAEGERLIQEFEEMELREIGEGASLRFAAVVEALEVKYTDGAPPTSVDQRRRW